ncbi:MAG TPA: PA14 domain-containing protein, partial [Chloroflexota bacterium]|nr:PA14 domain-containing protein [Chloroflexota bacterium]
MRRVLSRVGVVALALAVALLPGVAGQSLGGLPLSAVGVGFVALVLYVALALPSPDWRMGRWVTLAFAVALALKVVAATTAPPLGLAASYWAKGAPDGPPERSTDFPSLTDATRIESVLDLRAEDFGVHFFNDAARFNLGPDVQPGRDQLPFFVRWRGFLLAASDGERTFSLTANGPAHVWLDDSQLAADARVSVSAGLHALQIEYMRPEATVPRLALSWQRDPGGPMVPVGGGDARWQSATASATLSTAAGVVADGLAAVTLAAWLGLAGTALARRRGSTFAAAIGAIPLLFLLHGMLLHAPLAGRATILSGLDDWLVYESSARDILLHGWLMDGGQGHAAPFYGQPLYPYVLAMAHRLTGESLFGPLALQFAALGLIVTSAAILARKTFGTHLDALVAVAALWLLLQLEAEHFKVARQMFNENLYM